MPLFMVTSIPTYLSTLLEEKNFLFQSQYKLKKKSKQNNPTQSPLSPPSYSMLLREVICSIFEQRNRSKQLGEENIKNYKKLKFSLL